MPKEDNESSDEYCDENDTRHPWLSYWNSSGNLKTNSQAWNLHSQIYTHNRTDAAHR